MKYYFPLHLDGGNRGCEAISRGTAEILGENKENLVGLCTNVELDTRLGLDKLFTLVPSKKASVSFRVKNKLYSYLQNDIDKLNNFGYAYYYNDFLDKMSSDDVMLSTGGDMMCYKNCMANYTVDYMSKNGNKTVLWGCSVGKSNLTKEKIDSLNRFNAVVARESLTEKLFKELDLKNIHLYPDPAFILKPVPCVVPDFMQGADVIGINLSNFVGYDVSEKSIIGQNLRNLMKYIVAKTNMRIVLFPHVLWNGQDDRIICDVLYNEFKNSEKVWVLDSDKYSYCEIRYLISKCTMFIAARTHAAISAYSMCVPTFALGYSVKSIGIAKDLGLPEGSVADAIHVKSPNELSDRFVDFLKISDKQHHVLEAIIPEYINRLTDMKRVFDYL